MFLKLTYSWSKLVKFCIRKFYLMSFSLWYVLTIYVSMCEYRSCFCSWFPSLKVWIPQIVCPMVQAYTNPKEKARDFFQGDSYYFFYVCICIKIYGVTGVVCFLTPPLCLTVTLKEREIFVCIGHLSMMQQNTATSPNPSLKRIKLTLMQRAKGNLNNATY